MPWTAADVALILTTLGTLWGVVFPAVAAQRQKRQAKLERIASDFRDVLSECISLLEPVAKATRELAVDRASLNAGGNGSEETSHHRKVITDFSTALVRLEVMGRRYDIDVRDAIFAARSLMVYGEAFEFVSGKLTKIASEDRPEPVTSIRHREEFIQAVGEIHKQVDTMVERGKHVQK